MKYHRVLAAGLALSAAAGGFLVGRWSVMQPVREAVQSPTKQSSVCPATQPSDPSGIAAWAMRAAATVATEQSAVQANPKEADPLEKAGVLAKKLQRMVPYVGERPGLGPPSPGALERLSRPYVDGFAAALSAADSLVVQALADEITAKLCADSPLKEGQRMVFAQLADSFPAVLTSEGLDCLLNRSKGTEDGPVWDMVRAWRASGLAKTPAIAELEATAKDSRTRNVFRSPQETRDLINAHRDRTASAPADSDPERASVAEARVAWGGLPSRGANLPDAAPAR